MRSMITAAALALTTLFAAAPALAHGKDDSASYPMPAAAFKQKVTSRQAKAREHMEKRAAKLEQTQAKELRAKFDAHVAKVDAEVAKATSDGTVTKDEADAVRKIASEGRHHGKHARHGKHPKAPKK